MANSDKDILITPNTGHSAKPKIEVTGANNATKAIEVNDDGSLTFNSTIQATTGSVANNNNNLVTGDAVYDYIESQNFASSGASNFVVGDITGQSELTSGLQSTDELVLSDGGSLARMDISVLQSYMQSNLNFTTDTNTFRTVTAGGNTLGGTETLAFTAGSNVTITESGGAVTIASTDTNTQLSTEQVQDIIGAMVSGNTETNIAVTYDDTNGKLDFVSTDTNTQLTLLDEDTMSSNSATAAASQQSIKAYVDSEVAGLVDSAPSALNTLNELAAALGDDASFSTTTATSLGNRLRVDVSNQGLNSTQQGNALTNLGITATLAEINILDDGLAASDIPNLAASKITSGTLGTDRIPNLATSKITSGTFADARVAESNVTQHQAALSITESQISDLQSYLTAPRTVTAGGNTLANGETLAFTAGSNITISESGGAVTIAAAASSGASEAFKTIAVSGQDNVVADAAADTLTFAAGSNVTLTTNASTDTITIAATDTNTQLSTEQVQDIVGAMFSGNTETRISADYQDGDGTIDLVVDDMTADTNTFRTVTAGGNTLGSTETLAFTAGSNVTISESGGAVTIASTDTNTQLSNEQVQDIVGAMFTTTNTETGITVTYQDTTGDIDLVVGTLNQDTTGNAATATALETARNIGGVSFDGTANINLPGVNTGGNQDTSGNAATATALETARNIGGVSFDGTANINLPGVNTAGNQNTSGNASTATLASTVTVSDSTANTNFPVVFHNESNGLLDDTGALRYNPSTGTLLVPNLNVAGTTTTVNTVTMEAANAIVFEGATSDANETTLTITDPTADRTITLPNASGTVAVSASSGIALSSAGDITANLSASHIPNLAASKITSGTLGTDRIPSLATSKITSGTFANGRISEASVTQHQAALSITESQISDLGSYITAVRTVTAGGNTLASNETLAFTAGSNVTISESGGAVTIASTDTNTQLSTEQVQDIAGPLVATGGTKTRISVTYDDTNNNMDFVVDDMNFSVNDITGATSLTSGLASTDEFVINDAGVLKRMDTSVLQTYMQNNLTFTTNTDTQLSNEQVQDIAGPLVATGGTKTRISVTYDDTNNNMDFVVDDMNFSVSDITGATELTSGLASTDELVLSDGGVLKRMDVSVLESYMNSNLNFTNNSGDITGVTAGNGLTGGGTSGGVTLNIGAGTGIDVAADAISVDVSDFMTNGSNNRILTATGTDGMNAESNLTYDGTTLAVTASGTSTTLLLESTDAGSDDAPILELHRNSSSPANGDDMGQILWSGEKSDSSKYSVTKMFAEINTVDSSDRLMINIASSGGSGLQDFEYLRFDGGVRDVIFNEFGYDIDVRIEGDSDTALFFTDASSDRIGIGTTSPSVKLDVQGDTIVAGTLQGYKTSIKSVSSNTTLADADSGKTVYWTGGTLTLPATAEAGQQFVIINNTNGSATPSLGTSNSIATNWTAHAAMADETARTYIAVAANTWIYIG